MSEWADNRRKLSSESSAEPGQWRTSRAEYLRGIMDAFNEPNTVEVVFIKPSQVGATEAINNIVGYFIDFDPSPMIVMQPTEQMGEAYSKDRVAPMIRDTKSLREKVAPDKSRNTANTILHKSFIGGHLSIVGANSPAQLASRPIRIVLCDETDRYPRVTGKEGNPIAIIKARTSNFHNRKIGQFSSPTIKGESHIEDAFERSDKRFFNIKCPCCAELITLRWAMVRWDADSPAKGIPEQAVFQCDRCEGFFDDLPKNRAVSRGVWIATAPFRGVAGFSLNALYSPWIRLGDLARRWVSIQGNPSELQVFVNTVLGETWEDSAESIKAEPLLGRCEPYGGPDRANPVVPHGALLLIQSVDVQANRLEVETIGLGPEDETWGIENNILWGDPKLPAVWEELDALLNKTYTHESGARMKSAGMVIDAGDGKTMRYVLKFVRPRTVRRVFAVKGSSTPNAPLIATAKWNRKHNLRIVTVGTDTAKSTIYGQLTIEEPGPRYQHFPQGFGYDEEFFRQLTAETVKTKYSHGVPKREWCKTRDRNEALDKRVYALALVEILSPIRWDTFKHALEADAKSKADPSKPKDYALKMSEEPKNEPPKPAPFVKQAVPARRKGGFVGGWR